MMIGTWLREKAFMLTSIALTGLLISSLVSHCSTKDELQQLQKDYTGLEEERDAIFKDLTTAQNNVTSLTAAVNTCNQGVEALKTASDTRTAEAAKALNSAKELNKFFADRILYLQSQPRPANMSACDNARRLINEELANRPK